MLRRLLAISSLLCCMPLAAQAQDLVLGTTLPLTGPIGVNGQDVHGGMLAMMARVEREGGIAGRRVVLRSMDDAYVGERHTANATQLLEKDKVEALILTTGTTNINNVYPVIARNGRPLVGALTGASILRAPDRSLIYHLRASYGDEVRRMLQQARSVSQTRVYAVWQDDGLGRDAFAALQAEVKATGMQLVGNAGVVPTKVDGEKIGAEIQASNANAVFTLCITPCVSAVLKAMSEHGLFRFTPYALSIVSGETLAQAVGPLARGTVIAQVFPNPHVGNTPLVRQYQADMRRSGRTAFSYISLEGYLSARVAVEALRMSYGSGTRRSMDESMRILMQRDIMGMPISGGGREGVRPHFVTLSMIGATGELIH